jgi:hypothetical protein
MHRGWYVSLFRTHLRLPANNSQITCVRSSQGFDWNQDLFLPSYIDHDSFDLEHKQDPVDEIILTEEELANMLPS